MESNPRSIVMLEVGMKATRKYRQLRIREEAQVFYHPELHFTLGVVYFSNETYISHGIVDFENSADFYSRYLEIPPELIKGISDEDIEVLLKKKNLNLNRKTQELEKRLIDLDTEWIQDELSDHTRGGMTQIQRGRLGELITYQDFSELPFNVRRNEVFYDELGEGKPQLEIDMMVEMQRRREIAFLRYLKRKPHLETFFHERHKSKLKLPKGPIINQVA